MESKAEFAKNHLRICPWTVCHSRIHGCASDLKVVLVVKGEVVTCEN